jgi:hypothetical protein
LHLRGVLKKLPRKKRVQILNHLQELEE